MSKIKKIILFIILAVFFIAGGGLAFIWWYAEQIPKVSWWEAKTSPASAYTIRETPEGKIIENKKEGFTAKVPDGWKAKITEYGDEGMVNLFSPSAEVDIKTDLIKQGCGIGIKIKKYNASEPKLATQVADLKQIIEASRKNLQIAKENGYEIVRVGQWWGLKKIRFENPKIGVGISIEIPRPVGNKIFFFETLFVPGEEKKCSQELNKFLKTVTIK